MGKPSKNQRSGVKQAQRVKKCGAGHEMVNVLVAGNGMRLACACSGYAPINASTPYLSIKAPEAQGKACLPRKSKGSVPQGATQ